QPDELFGALQVVSAGGGVGEEAGEHGLADVHRVEDPPQRGRAVPQPGADLAAEQRLVIAHQPRGGLAVALPYAAHQVMERLGLRHGAASGAAEWGVVLIPRARALRQSPKKVRPARSVASPDGYERYRGDHNGPHDRSEGDPARAPREGDSG